MKNSKIILSIVIAGLSIYGSVASQLPLFLIGIPLAAFVGGSAYLAAKKIKEGARVRYVESKGDKIDHELAYLSGIHDGDVMEVGEVTSHYIMVAPQWGDEKLVPMTKGAFVLVD